MSDDIIKLDSQAKPKEKLLVRLFTRSIGLIGFHSYESEGTLVSKFFPDPTVLIHFTGVDELDQPVEHYFDKRPAAESGEYLAIVVVPMKNRKVLPVETQVTGLPGPMPQRPR